MRKAVVRDGVVLNVIEIGAPDLEERDYRAVLAKTAGSQGLK